MLWSFIVLKMACLCLGERKNIFLFLSNINGDDRKNTMPMRCRYLYYGETRHREKVEFDSGLREEVKRIFEEMHKYCRQQYTPKVKISKSCKACSLKDICLPVLNKNPSVKKYIENKIHEKDDME